MADLHKLTEAVTALTAQVERMRRALDEQAAVVARATAQVATLKRQVEQDQQRLLIAELQARQSYAAVHTEYLALQEKLALIGRQLQDRRQVWELAKERIASIPPEIDERRRALQAAHVLLQKEEIRKRAIDESKEQAEKARAAALAAQKSAASEMMRAAMQALGADGFAAAVADVAPAVGAGDQSRAIEPEPTRKVSQQSHIFGSDPRSGLPGSGVPQKKQRQEDPHGIAAPSEVAARSSMAEEESPQQIQAEAQALAAIKQVLEAFYAACPSSDIRAKMQICRDDKNPFVGAVKLLLSYEALKEQLSKGGGNPSILHNARYLDRLKEQLPKLEKKAAQSKDGAETLKRLLSAVVKKLAQSDSTFEKIETPFLETVPHYGQPTKWYTPGAPDNKPISHDDTITTLSILKERITALHEHCAADPAIYAAWSESIPGESITFRNSCLAAASKAGSKKSKSAKHAQQHSGAAVPDDDDASNVSDAIVPAAASAIGDADGFAHACAGSLDDLVKAADAVESESSDSEKESHHDAAALHAEEPVIPIMPSIVSRPGDGLRAMGLFGNRHAGLSAPGLSVTDFFAQNPSLQTPAATGILPRTTISK